MELMHGWWVIPSTTHSQCCHVPSGTTWQGNLNLEMQNNPGRLKFQSAAKHSKLPVLACRSSVQEGPTARLGVVLFAEETSVISVSNFVINFSMHTSSNKMLIDVLQP